MVTWGDAPYGGDSSQVKERRLGFRVEGSLHVGVHGLGFGGVGFRVGRARHEAILVIAISNILIKSPDVQLGFRGF